MHLLDDNPTTDDQLGFGDTADVLFQIIAGADRLPLTIGVFGGWGSGKTSLMQMVQARLGNANVKTVWFNAWKYDGKEVIWNALLQTIFYKMKKDAEKAGEPQKEFLKTVLHVAKALATYSAKVGTRFLPGGIVREEDVDALAQALGPSAPDELFEFVNTFETTFDTMVKEYVGEKGYLVVFVDDLDRCLPENAIQVMEALKLYLDRANCVFVVGVEPAVIEEAIRRRYAGNPFLSATEYLEKIVQVPFFVPRVRTKSALLLGVADSRLADSKQMERLVRKATERNPRRVKRFLNAYNIASRNSEQLLPSDQLNLAKVLLIQLCFPEFYRCLIHTPGLLQKLSGAEVSFWEAEGLTALYDDFALRQFLKSTRDVCPNRKEVQHWVRVAAEQSDEDDFEDDVEETPS